VSSAVLFLVAFGAWGLGSGAAGTGCVAILPERRGSALVALSETFFGAMLSVQEQGRLLRVLRDLVPRGRRAHRPVLRRRAQVIRWTGMSGNVGCFEV